MSSQARSPLLRFSVELRLEIYQHFWTIPREEKYLLFPSFDSLYLKATYIKTQLSAICTLGAICRTIRDEAYDEYFHTTQIYLGWGHEDVKSLRKIRNDEQRNCLENNERRALELIQSSYLLKAQARHICVRWVTAPHRRQVPPGSWRFDKIQHINVNLDIVMDCLATRFQNAVTLDIICDDHYLEDRIWREWREDPGKNYSLFEPLNVGPLFFRGIPAYYYDDDHPNRILSLRFRNLKKAVVHTVLTHPDAVKCRFVTTD